MTFYDDWSTAARASKHKMAVSERVTRVLDGGEVLNLELVKPANGDPYAVYATAPGVRCHRYKPSHREIDSIRRWKPW